MSRKPSVFFLLSLQELGFTPTSESCLEPVSAEPGSSSPLVLLRVSRTHMVLLSVSSTGIKVVRDLPKVCVCTCVCVCVCVHVNCRRHTCSCCLCRPLVLKLSETCQRWVLVCVCVCICVCVCVLIVADTHGPAV